MVKFNCIVLFFICPLIYFAQKVNNVGASQQGQNIVVTYDLETEQPCTINLFINTNGGTTWQGPLKQVQGQVGSNIKSGQNSITLLVLNEFNELRGDNIRFKVDANIKRNIKLRSDFANVFWKKEYILFDLTTDEPIFPINKNGTFVYQIYYCSNEEKKPAFGEFTPEQLENHPFYKFKNKENCIKFFNKN